MCTTDFCCTCYFGYCFGFCLFHLINQAQQLTQCPMAILTKAAPVLNVEHFIDIMPVSWELMLESDQELAAAAGKLFFKYLTEYRRRNLAVHLFSLIVC